METAWPQKQRRLSQRLHSLLVKRPKTSRFEVLVTTTRNTSHGVLVHRLEYFHIYPGIYVYIYIYRLIDVHTYRYIHNFYIYIHKYMFTYVNVEEHIYSHVQINTDIDIDLHTYVHCVCLVHHLTQAKPGAASNARKAGTGTRAVGPSCLSRQPGPRMGLRKRGGQRPVTLSALEAAFDLNLSLKSEGRHKLDLAELVHSSFHGMKDPASGWGLQTRNPFFWCLLADSQGSESESSREAEEADASSSSRRSERPATEKAPRDARLRPFESRADSTGARKREHVDTAWRGSRGSRYTKLSGPLGKACSMPAFFSGESKLKHDLSHSWH